MKSFKKLFAGFCALLMCISMSACSDPGKGDEGKKETKGEDEKIVMGFSQIGAESGWRTANTDDIKRAAKDAGIDMQFSDAQQKQENQIKAIRSFIANQVDIIVLTPIVEKGWDTVLKEAKDAEIPVLIVDRDIKCDDSLYVAKIGTDQTEEGRKAFNWLDKYLTDNKIEPKNGSQYGVAVLEGTVGASAATNRAKGWKEALEKSSNKDKYKTLVSQTGEFTRQKGKEVMESYLKSYKGQIDVLFAHNDDMALGAIQAIEDAGLKPGKDIIIVSCDSVKDALTAIKDGKINASIECNPLQGDLVMETAKKIVKGEEVERSVYVEESLFDATNAAEALPNRKY